MATKSGTIVDMVEENATPATHAVLQTAELLENVLLFLPPRDLLKSQRVCKFWKESVGGSSKAQQALFFRSVGQDCLKWEQAKDRERTVDEIPCGAWFHSNEGHCETSPVINPLMRRFTITRWCDMTSILHIGFVSPVSDRSAYDDPDDEEMKRQDIGPRNAWEMEVLHDGNASWRRMLFMQPACGVLQIRCDRMGEFFTISNSQGITLQNLQDGLREHWYKCPFCPTDCVIQRWDNCGYARGEVVFNELDPIDSAWGLLKELEQK